MVSLTTKYHWIHVVPSCFHDPASCQGRSAHGELMLPIPTDHKPMSQHNPTTTFLCHYSVGWLQLLFTCKQEVGRGCYYIWKIINWFLPCHFIVPAPDLVSQACHPSAGMSVWRNKVSLVAVGPWAHPGPISHWTVSNAFSCCKLWGGSISFHSLRELSCIKMLWLFPWQVLKTSYNYFSYRCKEAGSIMFRWSHLSLEVSKGEHNLISWQNSCSVFAGTPKLWVRTFQAWDPDLVTPE